MTNKQPDAQFAWATELSDAQGHVTLSEQEAHEIGARLRSMGEKLKAYEDLDGAASDVQLLRTGYAAARLEIESLQARIKTMAEERADELMVAHLDGRMRAGQPAPVMFNGLTEEETMATASCIGLVTDHAGEYPALPDLDGTLWRAIGQHRKADTPAESSAAAKAVDAVVHTLLRSYADATCAMRAAQPVGAQQPGTAYAELPSYEHQRAIMEAERNASLDEYSRIVPLTSTESMIYERSFTNGWNRHASHGQAPAQPDEDEALDLLEVLFDAWENGTPCYEDPETSDGFLGQAFRLDDAIFRRCADLLNRRRSNQIATTSPQAVDTQQAPAQAAPAAVEGCTRSHPHENMDSACRAKAAIAEMQNMAARGAEATAHDLARFVAMLAAAPITQPAPQQEALRLAKYVARRKLAKQLDANEIHGFDSGCDTEAVLLLSDIEAVLSQVAALTAAQPAADALAEAEYFIDNPSAWSSFDQRASDAIAAVCKAFRAARAPADSVTAPVGGETYHLGACIVEDMLHATVMRKEPGRAGAVTVLLSEQIPVEHLQDRDVIVNATPPAQAADSVLEDAARLDWLLLHISGAEFRRIGVHYSGNASRADVDAARKQGANHD